MAQDLVIRSARIIDGTGAPWFRADLRVSAGRIAAIGPGLPTDGATVLDGIDRYLAPGFIDAHCHDDLAFLRERTRPEKARQGVTSIVVGNCSFSLYPAPPHAADLLRGHFSGLLGETARDEVFADFEGYKAALEDPGIALNLVSLVGHAALRLAVMGYEKRAATPAEIRAMQALLAPQIRAGAAGLSLGLVYPPSAFAEPAELVALAETVRDEGGILAAHVRSYEAHLLGSIEEFIAVLTEARVPGLLSHLQSAGRPNWGQIPAALARLEQARAAGVDISFDMYPYPAGSSYMLQLLPPAAQEGGLPALLARLADPAQRAALQHWVETGSDDVHIQSKISLIGWGNVLISGVGNPALKSLEGSRMDAAAAKLGIAPFDLLARFVAEDDGQTAIVMFQLSEDDLQAACCHRLHMVGSDGLPRPGTKPHPRAFGTFPRVIGPLRRDRGWFTLEDAVRRMTAIPAQRFSLGQRGLLRPGMIADMVLFEDAVTDHASFEEPVQAPSGISDVWVAGQAVVAAGQITGRLPGKVLGRG
ncbi:D-aminoacylase [Acidisoma cellulosilytica]|uniref:D-aminoacylase n=1 Tax=Acidisoma cellulosilyticum TaxID=2802395 RepID=A0A963Z1Q0_9PROT|nr:D-aminoacylase [Acidisoma cellulosilyticum]MCB8881016.1 D-aminoacylase [Acidisoma cellulosilyticum]